MLNFLRSTDFPSLKLVHINAPIRANFLRQRSTQRKVAEPAGTSKRPRVEASTIALAFGDQPAAEKIHVDPTTIVDPASDDDTVDPTDSPPLSLCAMMESFMTTQAAHG